MHDTSTQAASKRHRYSNTALAVLCILPLLACLDGDSLMEGDEAIYAVLSRDIVRFGRWLQPHIDGRAWFDKPPLSLWSQAASMLAFGENLTALRLPMVVVTLVTALGLYALSRRLMPRAAARFVPLLFLVSPGIFGSARDCKFDAMFVAFQSAALAGLCLAANGEQMKRVSLLIAVGVGGAFLTKGFAGLVLPGVSWGLYCLGMRQWRLILRPSVVIGFACGAVIIAAYLIPMVLHFGKPFIDEQLLWSQLNRFREDYSANVRPPPLFYWHTFLWAALPVAPFAYACAVCWGRERWTRAPSAFAPWQVLCLAWCAAYFIIFGVAKSKLPQYIFPTIPAACLLVVPQLIAWAERPWFRIAICTAAAVLALAMVLSGFLVFSAQPLSRLFTVGLAATFAAALISRHPLQMLVAMLALVALWYCACFNRAVGEYKPSPRVVAAIARDPRFQGAHQLGVMAWTARALQFYRPVAETFVVDSEGAARLLETNQLVLCERNDCARLLDRFSLAIASDAIWAFPTQAITARFLDERTRPSVLREMHLLRVPF